MAAPMNKGETLEVEAVDSLERARLEALQPSQDAASVYFGRQASRYFTPFFIRAGLSANQATAVWGLLSLLNSFLIYWAIVGHYWAIPAVATVYYLVLVIDCVDGEVARYRGTSSPIGGKLLDGTWHKATEYSLLIAYALAAVQRTGEMWLLTLALVLVAGEGMYTFVYERRLTVIRVFAKSSEYITPTSVEDFYERGERWSELPRSKKIKALRGLVLYKSAYFMIAISLISAEALVAGLVLLTAFKHYTWMKLLLRTVNKPPRFAGE